MPPGEVRARGPRQGHVGAPRAAIIARGAGLGGLARTRLRDVRLFFAYFGPVARPAWVGRRRGLRADDGGHGTDHETS